MRTLLAVREQPGGGLEVESSLGPRLTLWRGPPPPAPPGHPGLARRGGRGELDGQQAWLEHRPRGARLDELLPLSPPEAGHVLLELAEALSALHEEGRAHGSVDPEHAVVDTGGQALWIGAGVQPGTLEEDERALRALMGVLWPPEGPPPPDPGQESAAVFAESLAGWLEEEFPDRSPFGLGKRAQRTCPPLPPEPAPLAWSEAPDPERGWVDEVGLDLGPDRGGRGLLDRWATGSLSGAITGALDRTRPVQATWEESPRRFELLARLLAPRDPLDPTRFGRKEGQPSAELKALIADEPLDPLPLPLGVSLPELALEPLPSPAPAWEEELPAEDVSPRLLLAIVAAIVVALLLVALLAWWLWV